MALQKMHLYFINFRRPTVRVLFAIILACFVLIITGQPSAATTTVAPAILKIDNGATATASTQIMASLLINHYSLTVTKVGNGAGRIASAPGGIDCGADCAEFYEQGALVTLTASANPGSTFAGWQGACSGSGAVCSTMVNTITEITAVFVLNQYQLTAAKAGNGLGKLTSAPTGIDCGNDCTEVYLHGSLVTLTASADPSSTFAGWIGACTGADPACSTTMDTAKSVTAIFILNQYSLTLTKTGNGVGKVVSVLSGIDCGSACSAIYPHGATLTLTAMAALGSTFTGWQGACTGTATTCTVTMDAAKGVTAIFVLNQYSLVVQKAGNGSGAIVSSPGGIDCGSTCTMVYPYGSHVNLTATAAANSRFTGWSGDCTGVAPICTVTVDAAKAVTATFVLQQYPLSVKKQGNGLGKVISQPHAIDCGSTCSGLYHHGTVITLTATADATTLFTGWQGACTTATTTCTVIVDAAKAVTATFILKQYDLTVSQSGNGAGRITSIPAGITCGITCTQRFDHGAVVTLTVTAAISSTFTGWQGACTGNKAVCAVTMDAAKAVTATFTLKQYALNVIKSGNGAGAVTSSPPGINCGLTCTQSLQHGAQITLTATAADNAIFTGWQGACTGALPTCALTIGATQQVTATFTLKQYTLTVTPTGNGSGVVTSIPGGINCGLTCTVKLDHGARLTLTATAAPPALLTGWQGACSGSSPLCVVTLDANKALTVAFTLKQYALIVNQAGSGAGAVTSTPPGLDCGSTCTLRLYHGTRITVTATAAISSTFMGWNGACLGAQTVCVIDMDRAQQVTATFALNAYDLLVIRAGNGGGTVSSSPAGIDCGTICTLRAGHGKVITLTATPDNASIFTGWRGACTDAAVLCTLTVGTAQAVTATFTHKQYALTVTKTGSGAGVVTSLPTIIHCGITCTASIEHGAVVTLTATASAHSLFGGWAGACTGFEPCVVTMGAAKALTATFTGEPTVSLSATITTTTPVATAGQVITYYYWITNTGDLSVTVAALSAKTGAPRFTRLPDQTVLSSESYLLPGTAAVAVQQTVAPRCDTDTPWVDTLTVTGTTSSGDVTTAQASITIPVSTNVLPPQTAIADTIYMGCTIQMALGLSAATQQQQYDMVVIVGPAPAGLIFHGVQEVQPYVDDFTLMEQTSALLNEGCHPGGDCRTVRRLLIKQGKEIQIETIAEATSVNRVFIPVVHR